MRILPRSLFRRRAGHDESSPDVDETDETPGLIARHRHGLILGGLLMLLVVIGFVGWLGVEASNAKSNLEKARDSALQAKDALLDGNSEEATKWVDVAQSKAQAARNATHSLPWTVASAVPWLGGPFEAGQQISDVVRNLAAEVLRPTADLAEIISPDRLIDRDGRADVQKLRDAAPTLSEVSEAAARLDRDAQAIRDPGYLSAIRNARNAIHEQTTDISQMLRYTDIAARVAPSMMGADGPRTYFMGFQTNAEARGTGGLLGAFGILRFDQGKPTVDALAPNTELNKPFRPINLGPEFASQYGFANPSTDSRNSNLSSHFPYAAQIWKSMWAQQSGMEVDGVVGIDPVALSYILGAEGPVTMPDGEIITKDNVVELTESTVYNRFPTDQLARKQYLQDVASKVVQKLTAGVESPRLLLDALGRAVSEGRIAVWSALPPEQELLEQTPLAHIVPGDSAPYAGVVINNLGGNKMDYYLKRQIEYAADGCESDTRKSTVKILLTNAVPDGPLPDYVGGTEGLRDVPINWPSGVNVSSVSLLSTQGTKLISAVANGQKLPVFTGEERGHPVFEVQVPVLRGQTVELSFLLTEPTSAGAPRVPIQPLVDATTPKVSVPECP